ncbi:ATP-binding SpoIIE family protein phosphatase [Desulfonema magnum]|uniref:Histidine kinase superfamily protein n=1 Tax=Desulfonema magnum TaxID=45655 RepID=A0A975BMS7_9BACT|nr:ATP-binding SpoIIE family protein phosphatase [Desulfonema magnum]QTA88053.1 Histidine kinase superfamily protein [Desulfonema magnum]
MNVITEKKVVITGEMNVLKARIFAKRMASAIGFDEISVAEIEIVVSELGTNIVKHAGAPGSIRFRLVRDGRVRGIEILVCDEGEGIHNIESMIMDGTSTTGTLGIGLSGVKRLMDEFDLRTSEQNGTVICAKKWIRGDYRSKLHCSVLCRPKMGERVSGDTYFFKQLPSFAVFSVIDALGHGPVAHQVAEKALYILENNYQDTLLSIIEHCHKALIGTRGCAMSLAKIDFRTMKFHHISIGNVETRVYGTPAPLKPVCTNGTLGLIMEHARINVYSYTKGSCIVMFSDGISNKFEVEPAMLRKTPQEISNFIFTKYARDHDDATVLVLK